MPRYRSKPKLIRALEFQPGMELPDHVEVHVNEDQTYAVYNELHDSWIKLKAGDMIRVDQEGDVYPIDAKTFQTTYELDIAEG